MLADLRQGLAARTVVLVTHNPQDIDQADLRLDLDAGAAGAGTPGHRSVEASSGASAGAFGGGSAEGTPVTAAGQVLARQGTRR